ncbi:extracellular solute-binding protein, partial [Caballeronia terrestris]
SPGGAYGALALPGLAFLGVCFVAPIGYLLVLSLHAGGAMGRVDDGWSFVNYVRFVSDTYYLQILLDTLGFGALTAAICAIFGFPFSYYLARTRSRWRTPLLFVTVLPLLISAVIRNFGWIPVLTEHGLLNVLLLDAGLVKEPVQWIFNYGGALIGMVHVEFPFMAGRALLIQTSRLLGGDEGNLDKAVAEISKVNARTFWQTSQQAEQLTKSGDIWLTVIADGRAWALQDAYKPARAARPKEGSIAFPSTADIVKGTPHPELAVQFVNEIYGALYQLGNATDFYYGPINRLLAPVISADPRLAAKLIYTPEQTKSLYHPNWDKFWAAHERARDLWNRTIVSGK